MFYSREEWDEACDLILNGVQVQVSLARQILRRAEGLEKALNLLKEKVQNDQNNR